MGIPGLINAIGVGERVSLAKLAGWHLERNARPIRIAVDISIWLFQVQASRGGRNPELRTLYFRLLKILALPIHPLFVYDGRHKPPFKRGKAVSRSSGNLPIIQRSKDLIEKFKFPWHEAPGEAEAECARLQQAGIVDAVISNDVDALMFGSTFTMMNFSNESGSGSSGATHVTCYYANCQGYVSNVPLDRAGMILFAMLSGGDYLPSGVEKCGPGTSAEIAKAGFGEDLLQMIAIRSPDFETELREWRERLQHELEFNESGYFARKHPAVRIPDNFPDPAILEYYACPKVSTDEEMEVLRLRLKHAWDLEIDPLAIRSFAAEFLDWKYRSGARKVIKNLAEPLVSYRLRRQQPVKAQLPYSLAPKCDAAWLQRVFKSRASFGTDGMTEFQVDMLPIDVVGLDLMAEEPNPPQCTPEEGPAQDLEQAEGEEDEAEHDHAPPATSTKPRVTKRYDVFDIQKIWVLESVVRLGLPTIVQNWEDEQAEKARKAAARKKSSSRKSAPKKKGAIDPAMKRGSILKYGTLTKERTELFSSKKSMLLESVSAKEHTALPREPPSSALIIDLEDDPVTPSTYSQHNDSDHVLQSSCDVDALTSNFSSLTTEPRTSRVNRIPKSDPTKKASRTRGQASASGAIDIDDPHDALSEASRRRRKLSNTVTSRSSRSTTALKAQVTVEGAPDNTEPRSITPTAMTHSSALRAIAQKSTVKDVSDVDRLQKSIEIMSLLDESTEDCASQGCPSTRSRSSSRVNGDAPETKLQKRHVKDSLPSKHPYMVKSSPGAAVRASSQSQEVTKLLKGSDKSFGSKQTSTASVSVIANQPRSTSKGYIENVVAFNGFWEANVSSETEGGRSQSTSSKGKERFARVSILDMT
ncbi:Uncharacterized protein PECH_006885 [Penicillium ucsense]|uniref:XPG-I domain-containing protein n=1 Tax=Penicillium ucsense TaxID=2839758 RepID=A0A8J8W8L8_9EURO|nr:Uncharacterized protein PECM_004566 [Penicillium ucsense]KAF7738930.1 Uncharacterized protein PECH_006885 [Penicillium ucsense]